MKKLLLLTLALYLSAFTCKTPEKQAKKEISQKTVENNDDYYIDEKFVENAIGFPITTEEIQRRFKNIYTSKKVIKNTHYPTKSDTIIELKNGDMFFKFYKTNTEEYIDYFEIYTNKISLSRGIRVGISKHEFTTKFNDINNINNSVEIGNLERTNSYLFSFDKDTLSEIKYKGYID